MPNCYISPEEIKATIPDMIQAATTTYDDPLLRYCNDVSRFIDRWCKRKFFPVSEVRYFDRTGPIITRVDDVLSISALEYSEDDAQTYAALAESGNWLLMRAEMHQNPGSYDQIKIDPNGTTLGTWPADLKALKATGIWAYADDRSDCWESSGDTVQDNPMDNSQVTLTVSDASGITAFGTAPRFGPGTLIRVESEYMEVTAEASDVLTVIRGRNGSSAASHVQTTPIDIWRAPEPVRNAAAIMAVRRHMRASQGFADSRADSEIGSLFFLKKIDPEAQELLASYRLKIYR